MDTEISTTPQGTIASHSNPMRPHILTPSDVLSWHRTVPSYIPGRMLFPVEVRCAPRPDGSSILLRRAEDGPGSRWVGSLYFVFLLALMIVCQWLVRVV